MGFFKKLFSKNNDEIQVDEVHTEKVEDMYTKLGLVEPVSDEERERVAVIASSILSGDAPDSVFKVNKVEAIVEERLTVAVIATSLAAMEYPDSTFKLVSIKEV